MTKEKNKIVKKVLPRSALLVSVTATIFMAAFGILNQIERGREVGKQILGTATVGLSHLNSAKDELFSQNFGAAATELRTATQNFNEARSSLDEGHGLLRQALKILPIDENFETVLRALNEVVSAVQNLDEAVNGFSSIRPDFAGSAGSNGTNFYKELEAVGKRVKAVSKQLSQALHLLRTVSVGALPGSYRDSFETALRQLALAQSLAAQMSEAEELFLDLMGPDDRTYLLLFQNNNEMRATGGFIGTYGVLDFRGGRMTIRKISSIYDLDGQLKERIAAPTPLQRQAATLWGIRDSNWFVDFPKSSRKALEFFEKESGILADGVISLTPDVFESLLKLTGPVEMPVYKIVLTAENFRNVVQFKTSLDYDRVQNQPKKFLSDFAPLFLEKIQGLDQGKWLSVMDSLTSLVSKKHIMVFSLDGKTQVALERHGLAGELKSTPGDFLFIAHSNVGGGKTDLGIKQEVEKKVTVSDDGRATVDLRITRTNESVSEKYFPKNVDFMRILVPSGSKLLSASGFDDHQLSSAAQPGAAADPDLANWESELLYRKDVGMYVGREEPYTFFANWQELLPYESKSVLIRYELPFLVDRNYTHLLQKQAGSNAFSFSFELHNAADIVYFHPANFRRTDFGLSIQETVNSDRFYGMIGQ